MKMLLDPPQIVLTDAGPVSCVEGEVSVSVSAGVAIRIVPVGPDGMRYPASPIAIADRGSSPDVQAFIAACVVPLSELVTGRRL